MNNKKIGIIIQARTDSTRFPRKVLAEIEGKPLLWHVIQRAKRIGPEVIVATTNRIKDDEIINIAKNAGVKSFRGSKNNVLERYVKAAEKYQINIIIRITSDCPLIDPKESKKVLEKYLTGNYDYTVTDEKTYPKGLDTECMDIKILKKILKLSNDKLDKEHVTRYIYQHPKKFKIGIIKNRKKIPTTNRWVVDYVDDLIFIKKIFSKLYKKNEIFLMKEIIELLNNEKI